MERRGARRDRVPELLAQRGGRRPGVAGAVADETGVPAADVYGVASFFSLLDRPDASQRTCVGLSCRVAGAAEPREGDGVSCLGHCDRAPVALGPKLELVARGPRGGVSAADPSLPLNLAGEDDPGWPAMGRAKQMGGEAVLDALQASGLQGRGGAGFVAASKWRAVRAEQADQRHVVVNADESEPGTFKDRELLLRRPHLVLEGAAIAAATVGAGSIWIYVRGEFVEARQALERALERAAPQLTDLDVHIVSGHGAYICGEETALLEALEGRRGMPRHRPPFPSQRGLWGQPTLVNNVETLACVPWIVLHGGESLRALGRTGPGTKLYCVSGHVRRRGVYELPLGTSLGEVMAAAGGPEGRPRAFTPGGAASGFLPVDPSLALDFQQGLGSAGIVVLDESVDMARAALWQQAFFEAESCGQCAPCRIGCRMLRQALERYLDSRDPEELVHVPDLAWEMEEGSICGLGMTASRPICSAMHHFPEDFGSRGDRS